MLINLNLFKRSFSWGSHFLKSDRPGFKITLMMTADKIWSEYVCVRWDLASDVVTSLSVGCPRTRRTVEFILTSKKTWWWVSKNERQDGQEMLVRRKHGLYLVSYEIFRVFMNFHDKYSFSSKSLKMQKIEFSEY